MHLWPPLDGTHKRKWEKQRNVYNQQEIHTLQKTRVLCGPVLLSGRAGPCDDNYRLSWWYVIMMITVYCHGDIIRNVIIITFLLIYSVHF